jgi:small subunit ribosomal protein S20
LPKHKSAKKRLKTSQQANLRNRMLKSKIVTMVKDVEKSLDPTKLKKVISLLDKGVRQRVIHLNKASRLKSRLTQLVNKKTLEAKPT